MYRYFFLLILCLILSIGISAKRTYGGQEEYIRSEVEKIEETKAKIQERRIKKRKKLSTKSRMKHLKHLSDSTSFADYEIQLQSVEIYADKSWPPFPTFSSYKEAKKAFKEPWFSGGYYRIHHNLIHQFRQPHDILYYLTPSSWGYITVSLLVDEEGNIVRTKSKTKLSPDIDEEIERVVLSLPPLHPATFADKKYPAVGTMVIEYEVDEIDLTTIYKNRRKGIDPGDGFYFLKLNDYHISWAPAITPII